MLSFLSHHLGTIVVGFLLLAGVAGIVAHLIRNKRKGMSVGCGCGCGSCPHASRCHND